MKRNHIFFLIALLYFSCVEKKEISLSEIIDKIDGFDCVNYISYDMASNPGDTATFRSYKTYWQIKSDTTDKVMGCKFLVYFDDTSKIGVNYHDNTLIYYLWENETATIDTINPEDSIIVSMAPLPIQIKSILTYLDKNRTHTSYQIENLGDTIKISVLIKDQVAEFLNLKAPLVMPDKIANSRFTIFLDPNFRPLKFIRKMPHQHSINRIVYVPDRDCEDLKSKQFGIYLPTDFYIVDHFGQEINFNKYKGQSTKKWKFTNLNGDTIKIADYLGKNLLLEFTGIGCGPCHAAISMLNELNEKRTNQNFELFSIESSERDKTIIKKYIEKNRINYEYLMVDKDTFKQLGFLGFPAFVFINSNGIIEKVILGYTEGVSEKEISKNLEQILQM